MSFGPASLGRRSPLRLSLVCARILGGGSRIWPQYLTVALQAAMTRPACGYGWTFQDARVCTRSPSMQRGDRGVRDLKARQWQGMIRLMRARPARPDERHGDALQSRLSDHFPIGQGRYFQVPSSDYSSREWSGASHRAPHRAKGRAERRSVRCVLPDLLSRRIQCR